MAGKGPILERGRQNATRAVNRRQGSSQSPPYPAVRLQNGLWVRKSSLLHVRYVCTCELSTCIEVRAHIDEYTDHRN